MGLNAKADFDEGVAAYERGDYAIALREWQLLAEQGHAKAQFSLGRMYSLGKSVPQNYVYAYMWVNIAASVGNRYVVELRNLLRNLIKERMTSSQITEAQKLARECVRRQYKDC